ncbi:LemA family protein [Tenacibaculum retecalamus]|uniref:LemA family protein n=1 Tax=Tenacibaculum retecalamus TaxID=3018315 RepID=UPI0023D922AD|nr:LemA family protein [Tenacibaculum retecalamus]WBX71625.1 LemA family protein [Tenacibaculum retecalamus]
MKKWLVPLVIVGVVVFVIFKWVVGFNNTAVRLNENVAEAWGNVETAYQRRSDLIGNLVKTVQGAADFEKETLTQVIEARAKATSTTINAGDLTPENMAQFQKAQAGLSGALSKLLVSVERYPDLKANQNFLKLQDELASTENQILTVRTRFNEAIKPYNNHVKVFPNSILAGWFGFEGKPYFEAEAGAEKAPDVNFDFGTKK